MQGIWKETVGGYNAKDTKRKKHTRKHTLKDKAAGMLRRFNKKEEELGSIPIKQGPILLEKTLYDNGQECEFNAVLYLVKVRYRKDFRCHKEGYRQYEEVDLKVYQDTISWGYNNTIVYNTGKTIAQYLGLDLFYKEKKKSEWFTNWTLHDEFKIEVKIVKELDYFTWNISDKKRFEIKEEQKIPRNNKMQIYDRLLVNRNKYKRTVSEKYAKQCTNRMKRRVAKYNILKEQYDNCLGEHPYYGYFSDYY